MTSHRPTKNEKRRLRKKEEKEKKDEVVGKSGAGVKVSEPIDGEEDEIVVEYVAASLEDEVGADSSMIDMFKDVFSKFAKPEELLSADTTRHHEDNDASDNPLVPSEESKAGDQLTEADVKKLSKRKKKLVTRLSVAELKQLVNRPDVVEAHDVSSSNPRLLIHLKSSRNVVAVPRHWCHIRKYLQGKRGIEKIPFQLPEFIAETGIARIRESIMEQEALQKSKQKARNRIRPKMGRIDIDYQVLHDAFFKHQTKPKLSGHGDLYYEGKEFEVCRNVSVITAGHDGDRRCLCVVFTGDDEGEEARSVVPRTLSGVGYARWWTSPVVDQYATIWTTSFLPESSYSRS